MSHHVCTTALAARIAAIWLTSAGATAATVLLGAAPVLALRTGPATFEEVLVAGCAVAASLGCLVLLGTTTSVAIGLLAGRLPRRAGPLRRAVLAACGVAVLATVVPAAAQAAPSGHRHGSAIAGLPLPDRPLGEAGPARQGDLVRVRPGDSLWTLARHRLGTRADDADVAAYCRRIYDLNAALIGVDPDLILPGQRLHLPPSRPLDR